MSPCASNKPKHVTDGFAQQYTCPNWTQLKLYEPVNRMTQARTCRGCRRRRVSVRSSFSCGRAGHARAPREHSPEIVRSSNN
eukprot:3328057-Pleurochrysis_carterae.AAC.1